MSLLEEMSIQGIRSFGPEHPQRVKFSTPVTLILGPNGTGKTTIIECLKYAVTGELPPGAKTGASFIHDPKLARSIEVKAKVTLKLKDVKSRPLLVGRSLISTQRETAKQPSLKTLDSCIKRLSPTGELVSLSSRGMDIDKEMVTSLGASKAVFDNVIFCHQEESNWPLQEAKAVKVRFDDLFASSRYVKALDAIRKARLEQESNVKIHQVDLKHLRCSKDEANQIRRQRITAERDLCTKNKALCVVDEKLNPITTKLSLYRQKYKELIVYQADVRSLTTEKNHLEAVLEDMKKQVSTEFKGTDEELKDAIEQTVQQLAEKQSSLTQAEGNLCQYRAAAEANEKTRSKLVLQRTHLDIEVKRLEEALRRRNSTLEKLTAELNIHDTNAKFATIDDNISATDVQIIQKHLETALKKAEAKVDQTKVSLDVDGRMAQVIIDEALSNLVRVEQSIDSCESALKDNEREVKGVEVKLQKSNSSRGEFEVLNRKLAEAMESRELLDCSSNEAEIKKSIREAEFERDSCEANMRIIDLQIVEAQQSAMANHERSMLEKNIKTAVEKAKKLRSRHLDLLEQIFTGKVIPPVCADGSQPSNSLTSEFNRRITELEVASKTAQHNLNVLQRRFSKMETELIFQREQLSDKQDTLRAIEERLILNCGSVNLERGLEKLMTRKKQLEKDYAIEEGSLHLWKKFCGRLTNETECPLCHRGFEIEQDHQDLKEEIEKRIVTIPRDLENKRKELEQLASRHEAFIELRPESSKFARLQDFELPELKAKVQAAESSLEELRAEIEEEASKLEVLQADESIARSLQGDMAIIEQKEKDAADLFRSLNLLNTRAENSTSRSVEDLQEERTALRNKCNRFSTDVDNLRKQLDQESGELQKAVTKENELRSALLKLEKECQAVTGLNTELDRLKNAKTRVTGELEVLRGRLPSCKAALTTAEKKKQRIVDEGEEKQALALAELHKWRDLSRQVTEACDATAFNQGEGESPVDQLKCVTSKLTALEATLNELKSVVATVSKAVEELHPAIANHKVIQRELEDCVRLRKTQSQLFSLETRVREIQQKISAWQSGITESVDIEEFVKKLTCEEESLREQKQLVNDEIIQLQTKLRMMEQSLSEKYGDAESKYMKKMYELKTAEMAATDLHHYYQALDRAIIAYHAEKMKEVNQIIRELWQSTYRGNDIDHIKICSEEEPLNASRARQTYNYRVVMVKAGSSSVATGGGKHSRLASTETPLDMRGRCSAGQKVLASLVIRMALAEVFCLQCGVLALDEPTTNLDRENIESLAYALTEIIKTRSSQRNFQLIVITHDENFIELLSRAGCAGHLQRLVRNHEGLSEVHKVRLEDQYR